MHALKYAGPEYDQIGDNLKNDFDILSESYQAIGNPPPLELKITTAERVWYRYVIDSLKSMESVIPRGDNHQYKFNNSLKVICDACSKSSNIPLWIFASVSRAYLIASSFCKKVLDIVR